MDSISSDNLRGSKRQRNNVVTACLNCRRRKIKCDGQPPTCGTCRTYQDVCNWDTEKDGRRLISKQYVDSLKEKIRNLEAELDQLRGKSSDISRQDSENDEDGETESEVEVANSMLHMVLGQEGEEVHFHGPTSSFAHSTTPATHVTSPRTTESNTHKSHSHDFKRFLPSSCPLTPAQHTTILDRFFRYFASFGLRANPVVFMEEMNRAMIMPPNTPQIRFANYSPFLHNIILSVGLCFADEENLKEMKIRTIFAEEAERYLKTEILKPSLATVQGLAIRSSWMSTQGEQDAGWVCFGMAERMLHSLGLGVNCESLVKRGRMSTTEMNLRRDTFWNIYIQQAWLSVYMGRPHIMQPWTISLPTVDAKLDATPWTSTLDRRQSSSLYSTAFVSSAKLAIIMNRMMTDLYGLASRQSSSKKEKVVRELGSLLDSWHRELPPKLDIKHTSGTDQLPHVLLLHLAKEWLVILIYRPYYRAIARRSSKQSSHTSPGEKAIQEESLHDIANKRCDASASRINTILQQYHDNIDLRFSTPALMQICFTAGTTHLLNAVGSRSEGAYKSAIERAINCARFLRLISHSWPSGGRNADILENMIKEYDQPIATVNKENRSAVSPTTTALAIADPGQASRSINDGVNSSPPWLSNQGSGFTFTDNQSTPTLSDFGDPNAIYLSSDPTIPSSLLDHFTASQFFTLPFVTHPVAQISPESQQQYGYSSNNDLSGRNQDDVSLLEAFLSTYT